MKGTLNKPKMFMQISLRSLLLFVLSLCRKKLSLTAILSAQVVRLTSYYPR